MPTCSSTTCLRRRSTVSLWRASLAATAFLSCCSTASSASNCGLTYLLSGDEMRPYSVVRGTGLPPHRRTSCSLMAHLLSLQAHCVQCAMQQLSIILTKLSYRAFHTNAACQADSSSTLAGSGIWGCALCCGCPTTTHLTTLLAVGQLQQGT